MLTPADAQVVKRDHELTGLETLLDNDLALKSLQIAFPEKGILEAQAEYLRYKPFTSCLVKYALRTEQGPDIAYARAYPLAAKDKIVKAVLQVQEDSLAICEKQAIIYQHFPFDRKLNSLKQVVDSDERQQLLETRFEKLDGLWQSNLSPIVYKPERRFVAKLKSAHSQAIIKLYNNSDFAKAYANAKASSNQNSFATAKLLGHSNRHKLLAFEFLEGNLLRNILMTSEDTSILSQVGSTLAELHKLPPNKLEPRIRAQEIARVTALLRYLVWLLPHLEYRLSKLANDLCRKLEQASQFSQTVHGDFYGKQILLNKQGIAIIDLDEAYQGDPAHDLGLFIAHLERDKLRAMLRSSPEATKAAFLSGYAETAKTLPQNIELYVGIELLGLMPHFFRNRVANWPRLTEALLTRAEELNQVAKKLKAA